MNSKENYTVNDDGSVTFAGGKDSQTETITDIFCVEFAKGGIFAGLRMYNRAVKYAKKAGIANPRLLVEKLMLEEYPTRFKTVKPARRLMWYVIAGAFFVIHAIWALIVVVDNDLKEAWWIMCVSALLAALFVKLALMDKAKIQDILTKAAEAKAAEMRQKKPRETIKDNILTNYPI